ncbi:MAG: NAD(P)-dependent oxidoreductase [Dialister sp.]|nr:NAD(P)-dependent oxidoreductase [Dialister sp.]
MIKQIVVTEPLHIENAQKEELSRKAAHRDWHITWYDTPPSSQEDLSKRIAPADMAIIANYPLKADALKNANRLSMLSIAFTGVDHVDLTTLQKRNVATSNCAGYATHSVAELTLSMALSLLRYGAECDKAVRNHRAAQGLRGTTLFGKTWGIIGTGAIGRETARLAAAFGCQCIGFNRHETDPAITYMPLSDVLAKSDIVSIHVPLTPSTKHLIGKNELSLMKASAILINTARGPVVDTDALAEALCNNCLAGAGIDVFDTEPPLAPDTPILKAPHTILSPHIGFDTKEAMAARADMAFENLAAFEEGRQKRIVLPPVK